MFAPVAAFNPISAAADAPALNRIPAAAAAAPVVLDVAKDEPGEPACVVCTDNAVAILFKPCNHLKTCRTCTNLLATKEFPFKCPICRDDVTEFTEVFL